MRAIYAALVLAAVSPPWAGAAPPDAPKEVQTKAGKPVVVSVKLAAGAELGYCPTFKDGEAFFEELAPRGDTRRFMFWADVDGSYAVAFWTKGETTGTATTVRVGAAPPVPVPPDPPGPNPPDPPAPADPLVKALAAAYRTETAPDRRERMKALAGVMRTAADYAQNPTVATNADLAAKVTAKRKADVADSLPAVRAAIGGYLATEFPTDLFNLTAEHRTKFAAAYTKLSAALEEVSK